MTHVITQACCNEASCVAACPVNCIHPTPEEPDFGTAEMLYIDPDVCTDCGACVPECPTDAIVPDTELADSQWRFLAINAGYYDDHDVQTGLVPWRPVESANRTDEVRVAIVGAGPAGFYAARRLLVEPNVEVDLFDRLPTPYGLVRGGVAPDHPSTKKVAEVFESVADSPRVRYRLGVEVGRHITPEELTGAYHSVIYAYGSSDARSLGIPGEGLAGSVAATEFVGWYNGHPDYCANQYDLSGERAVIIGNGNVALDVARILLSDPERLAATDIAGHALEALRRSNIREVVIVARRGPADAAYTIGEFVELLDLPGVEVAIDPSDLRFDAEMTRDEGPRDSTIAAKVDLVGELAAVSGRTRDRRLVFRFHTTPVSVSGDDDSGVTAVEIERSKRSGEAASGQTPGGETIRTGLVIRAVGYAGRAVAGIPFDDERGTIPHHGGRILDSETGFPIPGQYVVGWIKRGSRGGIGANRFCAEETALALIEDLRSGRIPEGPRDRVDVCALATCRGATVVDLPGWKRIDSAELAAGSARGRPREKLVTFGSLVDAAR